jgi:glycosyltransferase involved in cell wall biosynthesis
VIPEITVVIPTYNRRAMVREAAASVIAQSVASIELIVVDDGSTDGTAHGLEAELRRPGSGAWPAGASRIRVVSTAHRGVSAARNRGIELACGEYIAFLDADDLWSPAKIENQLRFMRGNPSLLVSQCEEIWIRSGRRVNPGLRHRKQSGDFFVDSLTTCLVSPSAVIAKTEFLRSIAGFDERFTACEDYDLWLRILADHPIGLLPEALVVRRAGHPDQLSAMTPALDRFRILTILKLLSQFDLRGERREAACAVLREKCRILTRGLARRGKLGAAALCAEIESQAYPTSSVWRSRWAADILDRAFHYLIRCFDHAMITGHDADGSVSARYG